MACNGPIDVMGWVGGDGHCMEWGPNVPTWHFRKQHKGLWVARSWVMGWWGVVITLALGSQPR
jgi:hypothetical protein